MEPQVLQTVSQFVIAAGIVLTAAGGLGSYHFGKKADQIREAEANREVAKASEERSELKEMLEPFVAQAEATYPGKTTKEALESLATQLGDLRKDVGEIAPFRLTQQVKDAISAKLSEAIANDHTGNPEFVLFPQQTPEAAELVQFLRSVFRAAGRDIGATMVGNSRIPPSLRGIIFVVKDQNEAPGILTTLAATMNSLRFQTYIVQDKRMAEEYVGISAQRPMLLP